MKKPKTFGKTELVREIAHNHSISSQEASAIVTSVYQEFRDALLRKEVVILSGIGRLAVKQTPGRSYKVNPRSGEQGTVTKAACNRIAFRTSDPLRRMVNQ